MAIRIWLTLTMAISVLLFFHHSTSSPELWKRYLGEKLVRDMHNSGCVNDHMQNVLLMLRPDLCVNLASDAEKVIPTACYLHKYQCMAIRMWGTKLVISSSLSHTQSSSYKSSAAEACHERANSDIYTQKAIAMRKDGAGSFIAGRHLK